MFSSLNKLLDLQFFIEEANQASSLANIAEHSGSNSLSWEEIVSNISIITVLLSQTFGFIFKALGWIGGWGIFLVLLSFVFLSFLNFLSPFKRANYFLVLFFVSFYACWSSISLKSVFKFVLLMLTPALLTLILYLFSNTVCKLSKKKKSVSERSKDSTRQHVPLAAVRRQRRRMVRFS